MPKFLIAIIVVIVIAVLIWLFYPRVQVVKLIPLPGSNEPDLEHPKMDVLVRWNHIFGSKVRFVNESRFDGVLIQIPCTEFFTNPPSDLDFTLALGESRTLTLRRDIPSGAKCTYKVDPYGGLPGPELIKRP